MNKFIARRKVKINLTIAPLIDIIFLLLLFFMLSYHFAFNPGMKLNLPEAVTAQAQDDEEIVILINKKGELLFNGEHTTLERLEQQVSEKMEQARSKTIVIKADQSVDFGDAVKVMDSVRHAGAKSIVISTQMHNER